MSPADVRSSSMRPGSLPESYRHAGLVVVSFEVARDAAFQHVMLAALAITWGLGIAYRRRPAVHVRSMISTVFTALLGVEYAFYQVVAPMEGWMAYCDRVAGFGG